MYTWVSTEFRRHGIPPSKRNSVDTEFRIQKYAEFRGIPWNFANFNSQSLQYVSFWYFKYKFVRIKSEISGLAEVESASFFLVR